MPPITSSTYSQASSWNHLHWHDPSYRRWSSRTTRGQSGGRCRDGNVSRKCPGLRRCVVQFNGTHHKLKVNPNDSLKDHGRPGPENNFLHLLARRTSDSFPVLCESLWENWASCRRRLQHYGLLGRGHKNSPSVTPPEEILCPPPTSHCDIYAFAGVRCGCLNRSLIRRQIPVCFLFNGSEFIPFHWLTL